MIGYEGNPFKRKRRKPKKKPQSVIQGTPFKSQFRWRRY